MLNLHLADYRLALESELNARRQRNSSYSLRAFAVFLGISPATLSQVLARKRSLSEESRIRVARAFQLDSRRHQIFNALVLAADAPTAATRAEHFDEYEMLISEEPVSPMIELNELQFNIIADWYHLVILESLSLREHQGLRQPRFVDSMTRKLALAPETVRAALYRLKKLDLIVENDQGMLVRTSGCIKAGDRDPERSLRAHHADFIRISLKAIEHQAHDDCDFSGAVIAIQKESLGEAKEMIRDFRRRFISRFDRPSDAEQVVRLNVGLFKVG